MKIELEPLDEKTQDRLRARTDQFFDQTLEQNNERLNTSATTIAALRREIKFIESILLARGAN
jgi:hypothetical protein